MLRLHWRPTPVLENRSLIFYSIYVCKDRPIAITTSIVDNSVPL